ncbi:MAG: EscU/YscU/HrcU family type III secretion system export apparatus switch protein [Candidatus Binatia bacterium]
MAEDASNDELEKSEEPTPKRREEASKRGQFPKSSNLIPTATLGAIAIALKFGGEQLMERLGRCVTAFFTMAGSMKQLSSDDIVTISFETGLFFAPVMLPIFAGVIIGGLGFGFLQTGFVLASEPLRFDLNRINPVNGLSRLFSLDSIAESIKASLFISVLGCIGGVFLYGKLPALMSLPTLSAGDILAHASRNGAVLGAWIIGAMVTIAGFDYLYQRWRIDKQLRMSRQELKEEMREHEGDPLLKSHLRSMRQKMSRRRMMSEVAKADVVITNPTHLAIALRYRAREMGAPRVVGKGAGFIAEKIREVARSKGIPVIENRHLAQLLYRQVEIGREIPESLYRAVAGILAYVFRLRGGNGANPTTEA